MSTLERFEAVNNSWRSVSGGVTVNEAQSSDIPW